MGLLMAQRLTRSKKSPAESGAPSALSFALNVDVSHISSICALLMAPLHCNAPKTNSRCNLK